MSPELAAVLITVSASISGSWLVARTSARNVEQQAREADHARIKVLEDRTDTLMTAREADHAARIALNDHIDTLEHHIWSQKPPPPPPRPGGI